jgi:hypothetical protein
LAESDYGAGKTSSFIGVLRMAARRGLNVTNIARRFIKGICDNYEESKFDAWLMTPVIFGGFGFGVSGRQTLNVRTKVQRRMRVYVTGLGSKSDVWKHAAKQRALGVVPLPGLRNRWNFVRVRGTAAMEKMKAQDYFGQPRPKTDWVVRDLKTHKDAYLRKLNLEWKLASGHKIEEEDLPNWFGHFANLDRAYRRYRRLVSDEISLESVFTGPETYVRFKDWSNRVWSGICYKSLRMKIPDSERRKLCALVHGLTMTRAFKEHALRVCV